MNHDAGGQRPMRVPRRRRRVGGPPLVLYVTALLLLPLAGVGILSYREVARNGDAADAARRIERAIDVQTAAVNVVAPLEVERTALLGLARIDAIGVDRDLALSFIGVDLDAILAENSVSLAAALDGLEAALDAADDESTSGLGATLDELRRLLDEQGHLSEDLAATPAGISAVTDEMTALLDQAIAEAGRTVAGESATGNALDLVVRLDAVATVGRTASDDTAAVIDALLHGGDVPEIELLVGHERHRDALDAAAASGIAVGGLRLRFEALSPARLDLFDPDADVQFGLLLDPDAVATLAQLMLERVDYLEAVGTFALAEGADASAEATAIAETAERRTELTLIGLGVLGVASLVFGAFVIRSFIRPLRRLRTEAGRISGGELSVGALPAEGPSDVRRVTAAVNEMTDTLTLVDEHMKRLASGRPPTKSLMRLPGEVGASIRESVGRVTELTARLQASEARLVQEARHDHLTDLPNRFAVLEHLTAELHHPGARVGVMFVDIDGFKSVNDTHGHAVGDIVLREIGRRLRDVVREHDFVARLGGDEFIVVAGRHGSSDDLVRFGERIIGEVEQPYTIADQLFAVSASVGVSHAASGDDPMRAIERADAAVYQAKQKGRRRVELYDADLQSSIEQQSALELALRQAIADDELWIALQPIGAARTGAVIGAEALVRWNRPGVGPVAPDEFIPIAERSGLIFDLERWVLHEVCDVVAAWRRRDPACAMRVAVNISGRHLIEGDLVADVVAALEATGADPTMLELELTESQLLDDVGRACELLGRLRQLGITIAIDDFGTGYSSMTYLRELPIDTVKIDRSFVARATENGFDSTVIEAIVTIGRSLALEVVAEGVETVDQLAYLAKKGATRVQGYLLARPMPIHDATEIVFGGPIIDLEALLPTTVAT